MRQNNFKSLGVAVSTDLEFHDGLKVFISHYLAACGCRWDVDMWGNVRTVSVCLRCGSVGRGIWEDQRELFSTQAVVSE